MNDILEIEFQIEYNMKVSQNFDSKEYYELIWKFERIAEQRQKENEKPADPNSVSLANLMGGQIG